MERLKIIKIVSGGQTGADRAALDWAIKNGISHGGWCPKGRRAEDGPIDAKFQLKETPSSNYLQRTEWNARDSDSTVIFSIGEHLTGGSLKTVEFAIKHRNPASVAPGYPWEILIRMPADCQVLKGAGIIRPPFIKPSGLPGPTYGPAR